MGAELVYGGIVGDTKVGCCNGVEEAVATVVGMGCFAEVGRP